MSDIMTSVPFRKLLDWVLREKEEKGTIFGVRRPYEADPSETVQIFGRKLETQIGPAAGPHTQLAQNIAAAYVAGSRFFELKTVQIMDGEELSACVNKPCILAEDEGYNCEWSTELYVPQAMEEYIKAWFLLHIISKEYGLGAADGFQFNISVGYDLVGIKSEKINTFIDTMTEAKDSSIFKECMREAKLMAKRLHNVTEEDIEAIPSDICNSATISTLHGCPPQEIESIADYLLKEKGLHTFIKCNPTLLGYEFARKTMDGMGYDYMVFGDFHFKDDLQYEDAVPMLTRLMKLADEKSLEFGVKITNTFPVDVKENQLPSGEMYMSGKALFPLSISLAAKLSEEFRGKLRISYSGGADAYNIAEIVGAGIWPVTVATTLLKPGGYQRLSQMAEKLQERGVMLPFKGVDVNAVSELAVKARTDKHHVKAAKPLPSRKMKQPVPLLDCYVAPCKEGCPIHQDITAYMPLTDEGKYKEALEVIMERNPLPFITGTICAHNCMSKCTRNFYEEPVHIRDNKLKAAMGGYEDVLNSLNPAEKNGKKAAVIGGGPAGMACAYYLAKAGTEVTLYEKTDSLGGVVRHVIPEFRIPAASVEKDASFLRKLGVDIQLNVEIENAQALRKQGYDAVILAVGASKPGELSLEKGGVINALEFLKEFKEKDGDVMIGKNVAVIGGGNTAMDTARAAKRTKGVEHVYLVYRRTKRYMPADEEELLMAVEDGVEFKELLSPVLLEDGELVCKVMELSDPDKTGRRSVKSIGKRTGIPADTVIAAVGEQVPSDFYQENGIQVDSRGRAKTDPETLMTSQEGIYVIGDGLCGPATVVEGMRDAMLAASDILGSSVSRGNDNPAQKSDCCEKKGILKDSKEEENQSKRCLGCDVVCENCVDVCPNRANVSIHVPGFEKDQVVHIDYMCNECGNCRSFCPYDSAPYLDKFTLFANEKDMENSKNDGFFVLDREEKKCLVRYLGETMTVNLEDESSAVTEGLRRLMTVICEDYAFYLL